MLMTSMHSVALTYPTLGSSRNVLGCTSSPLFCLFSFCEARNGMWGNFFIIIFEGWNLGPCVC